MDDDVVSTDELREAVEHMHGVARAWGYATMDSGALREVIGTLVNLTR